MLWFTLFLLCIALEIITGNGMVTLNQSWCIIKRHYGLFSSDITRSQYIYSLRQSAYWRR